MCRDYFTKVRRKDTKSFYFDKPKYKNIYNCFLYLCIPKGILLFMNIRGASFLIFALFNFMCGSAQVSLCYDLQKNDIFTVKQNAVQVISQNTEADIQEITNNIAGVIQFTVTDVKTNFYVIEMKFIDLKLTINSNIIGELMNVDAKVIDENNPQSKLFNGILNFPITFHMKKDGDIILVDGGDDLIENMLASASTEDEFTLELMKTSLERDFGSNALAENYKQMTYFYPENEVALNSSWENSYSGELTAYNVWKLKSLNNNEAFITADGVIKMNINDPGITMSLEGNQKIKLTTNFSNGFLKELIIESSAKGNSIIQQTGDTLIPTTITSKITFNLIK